MPDKNKEHLATAIRDFILELRNAGEQRVTNRVIDGELEITTKAEKDVRRQTIASMKKLGQIEPIKELVGVYRIVDGMVTNINWQSADPSKILALKFPFGLEKYFIVCPKNIGIIAGEKDAGKTAFLLNLARLNQDNFNIVYFSSEMGELELRRRLEQFEKAGLISLKDWKCEFVERNENFADVIRPDWINLVDFLEVYDDYFKMGGYINQIYRKIDTGAAFIAIQKNKGSEWGLGKERGLEKARFYLTMGDGKLKIKSAKNWTQENVNPVGKELGYKLVKGCKFVIDNQFDDIDFE